MKYLIGVLLAIVVIIFVIAKLLTAGGGSGETQTTPKALSSYATTATVVRYTVDNPVQSVQNHRDIVITVGKDQATLTVTKGYQGEVVRSQSYPTSPEAYANFLLALDRSGGYTRGNPDPKLRDERGYCATGSRYSYDIVDAGNNVIQHYWSTSCGQKTFKGDPGVVEQLFTSQIPNYDDLTSDIDY